MSDAMLEAEHALSKSHLGCWAMLCVRSAVEFDICVQYGMDVEEARMNNV
jgi:hypothetical protein